MRGVYAAADYAHSSITLSGDLAHAHQAARDARARLAGATIDVEQLERWLSPGSDVGGEPWRDFVSAIKEELDQAVAALAAATADEGPDSDPPRP